MGKVKKYNPKEITLTFAGSIITGFSQDCTIVIAHNEDASMLHVGLQGDAAYADNANKSGTLKFNLMQTSASLTALRAAAASHAQESLVMNDPSDGGVLLSSEDVRVQKVPDVSDGKEVGSVEVILIIPEIDLQ